MNIEDVFNYDPLTGIFTRVFQSVNNTYKAGEITGFKDKDGYIIISFRGKEYKAHRVAFLLMGEPMPKYVDHIDRNPSNNIWTNLRAATHSLNMYNTGMRSHNTSGHKGVTYNKRDKTWGARIGVNGKQVSLGTFTNIDSAIAARKAGESRYYGG